MATGTRRSLSSFLRANDAQLRKRYARHCRRERGPLRHRPHTRSCMLCFIVRVRMSAIAKGTRRIRCTTQNSADSETGRMKKEERQTRLGEEPEMPPPPECRLGICDTGYNSLGEPLYCDCEDGDANEMVYVWDSFVRLVEGGWADIVGCDQPDEAIRDMTAPVRSER
ncbi:hypothetical protein VTK26DRAFT_8680 [Humicola hyalothermophila]